MVESLDALEAMFGPDDRRTREAAERLTAAG
jgi:hypothetical protein